MKTSLFALCFAGISALSAQSFNHSLGVAYTSFTGAYGNGDQMAVLYTPRLTYGVGSTYMALSAPMQFGKMVSSARSGSPYAYDLPLAAEWGFSPDNIRFRGHNAQFFIGSGISFRGSLGSEIPRSKYALGYAGMRMHFGRLPLELKVQYASNNLFFPYSRTEQNSPFFGNKISALGFGISIGLNRP